MRDVAVVGAGKIGGVIARLLSRTGDYRVAVLDRSEAALAALDPGLQVQKTALDVSDPTALAAALAGRTAVVNASPFHLTLAVAEAARRAGCAYFDLTEDVASTRAVRALAEGGDALFAPQCGLAPGFVTIVAADLAKRFDRLDEVKLRVGALPRNPSNALGYNLTWSTDGVINEYCEPCEAIVEGRRRETLPLEECERFVLDGVEYEAFNTSGGLGSLCESLDGRVRTLNYRTIRYPGHAAAMRLLLNDLGLRRRREILKDVLETGVPATRHDVVLIFVVVSGWKDGRYVEETDVRRICAEDVAGTWTTAIQITTASGICAVVDLAASGALKGRGLLLQEEIGLDLFLANRFGRAFAEGGAALATLAHAATTPVRELATA